MKKILFFAALCVATMFVSCGQCSGNASGADSDTVVVDSADSVADTVAVDSTVCPD